MEIVGSVPFLLGLIQVTVSSSSLTVTTRAVLCNKSITVAILPAIVSC